jgi:hypothetical protein
VRENVVSQALRLRFGGALSLMLIGAIGVGACGSIPPPRAELSAAEVAVQGAVEADAAQYAPTHLTLAQDKLTRARAAMDAREFVAARRLAEQAEVDAQLAEATARSALAQAHAAELRETIRLLREEIERQQRQTS